ncbi:MAG: superoxide dismutase [Betaproteobacteria bacterium]
MNPSLKSADVQTAASDDGKPSGAVAPSHVLPPLPYAYSALEPCIDAHTMTLHHDKHHASYVEKLNAALAPYAELRRRSAAWLLVNGDSVPELVRAAVQNNAGGHLNHSFFWQSMSPAGGAGPSGPLAVAIDRAFGSFDTFKAHFVEAGAKVFGSGWVWLVASNKKRTDGSDLEIVTTSGHDNPIRQAKRPLLVNDVWEHAYYLKYENRRPDYLTSWWPIVNWKEVARRFENPNAPD